MSPDDLFDKMKKEDEWYKARPLLNFIRNSYYFVIYRIPGYFSDGWFEVKEGFRRMFRGYGDYDVWGYNSANSVRQIAILSRLRRTKCGFPYTVFKEDGFEAPSDVQEKAWDKILDTMIDGFQAILDWDEVFIKDKNGAYDPVASDKARAKCMRRFKKGMKVYTEYYFTLWD